MLIPMQSGFSMTNESCHFEPRHDRGEESLLLNDEILRPEEIGIQHDSTALSFVQRQQKKVPKKNAFLFHWINLCQRAADDIMSMLVLRFAEGSHAI